MHFRVLLLAALMALAGVVSAATDLTLLAEATVRKVDPSSGKVTLAHGPLKNLGMPAMTMAFKLKDASWLDRLKAGDRIRFHAEMSGSDYVASQIEKQPAER